FFFSSRRRHTRFSRDWSSDVCSSDLEAFVEYGLRLERRFPGRVVALAYGNDAPGYLPTRAAHAEGGYELAEAHRFYGRPGPVGQIGRASWRERVQMWVSVETICKKTR